MAMRIYLSKDLREASRLCADDNRKTLAEQGVLMINLMGSPGSGKTTLLEHTMRKLSGSYRIAVIEGDLYTAKDAERLSPWCKQVTQINTEGGCHLDAGSIGYLLKEEALLDSDLVVIENVGNLICPAEFDLGEDIRVTQLSVTEGDDKPAKYPLVFKDADCVLITKLDLLPYCNFNLERVIQELQIINQELVIIPVSVYNGEGFDTWINWLVKQIEAKKKSVLS